jgi:hypothetical protein
VLLLLLLLLCPPTSMSTPPKRLVVEEPIPLAATCFFYRVDFFVTPRLDIHLFILSFSPLQFSQPHHTLCGSTVCTVAFRRFIIPKGFNNDPPTPLKEPTTPDLNRE